MTDKLEKKDDTLYYKGRPLVRVDKTIYYGDPGDDFVVMMNILSTEKVDDEEIPAKILVQCLATDTSINPKDRIVKKAEREGLYPALQIASIWLSRSGEEKK